MTVNALSVPAVASPLDLAGAWHCRLDRNNLGVAERWFAQELTGRITLPGSLPGESIGDPITVDTKWTGGIFDRSWFTAPEYAPYREPGNIKVPFWLQPETHYVGAAWFQREIEIPADWTGRRVVLSLERPHWKTTGWLDAREIGSNDTLSLPHRYDLGATVSPGRHVLTLRVDNTPVPDLGENSHSLSDHTQGNWLGIVGALTLHTTATTWIEDLQVFPQIADRTAHIHGHVAALPGSPMPARVHIQAASVGTEAGALLDLSIAADGRFEGTYPLGAAAPQWDEFSPALHRLVATLDNGESHATTFGLREIGTAGRQLTINGRKLFLRGALDCAAFPRTGHPPTDVSSWKHEFAVIQSHGLNHLRFHSWCPPEAAFVAADELGLYLQIEVASWPNQSTTLGDGRPVDAWLDVETDRILREYGNHPSFVALCACNEPGGDAANPWLARWITRHRAADPRRLYTAGAGWPDIAENDFHIRSEPRIQHWEEGLKSRLNALPPETRSDYREFIAAHRVPVVSHEIGQWCAYPNFDELPKYTGYLKPRNFEIFRASLAAHHLADQAHDFLLASGKLQALCYKEDIESALRTPEMGGFQLLGLADFPGQGTALVGVLDAFWEEKGYLAPADFRRFCHATVPLARLAKRVFTTAETLEAEIEVAHFGAAPLAAAPAVWQCVDDGGHRVASGEFPPRTIPVGAGNALGRIELALGSLPAPAHYRLIVALTDTPFENDWDFWIYPTVTPATAAMETVLVTPTLDATAEAALAAGGTVFLTIAPAHVRPDAQKGPIALGFSSIFWNTAWTHGQAPHTLGLLCNPQHPAFAAFPTEAHSNWQWWFVVTHAAPMILDELPASLRPTLQVIDDWVTNRKLGLVFEARVGRGKLLVTSIDLSGDGLDPVRRQLRASLLSYAAGPYFAPTIDLTVEQVKRLNIE